METVENRDKHIFVEECGAQMLLFYLHVMVGSQLADSHITSYLWLKLNHYFEVSAVFDLELNCFQLAFLQSVSSAAHVS